MIKKLALSFFILLSFSASGFCGQVEDAILQGGALAQKKDYDGAIKEFEKALKLDPKNSKAHILMGLTYANKGDLDKALKFTQYAIMLEKSYAGFHNLGLIYANKGEYQNAVDAYENALKLSPESANAWYQLGMLHSANGHFNEAITAYKKSITLNPKLDKSYLGLGGAYYWAGDKKSALEQAEQLRLLKMKDEANELESWIQNKEDKKKEVNDAMQANQKHDQTANTTPPKEEAPSVTPSPSPSVSPTA